MIDNRKIDIMSLQAQVYVEELLAKFHRQMMGDREYGNESLYGTSRGQLDLNSPPVPNAGAGPAEPQY